MCDRIGWTLFHPNMGNNEVKLYPPLVGILYNPYICFFNFRYVLFSIQQMEWAQNGLKAAARTLYVLWFVSTYNLHTTSTDSCSPALEWQKFRLRRRTHPLRRPLMHPGSPKGSPGPARTKPDETRISRWRNVEMKTVAKLGKTLKPEQTCGSNC